MVQGSSRYEGLVWDYVNGVSFSQQQQDGNMHGVLPTREAHASLGVQDFTAISYINMADH